MGVRERKPLPPPVPPCDRLIVFGYARPESLPEALELVGAGARPLAGGTDLLVGLRKGKFTADRVVDLKAITELQPAIYQTRGGWEITAGTVMSDIVDHPGVRARYPALVQAASAVGSIQIRNRATLAGNVCNASPAADTAPPLLVYDASVVVAGADGERTISLVDFFVGPGQTALLPGELVTRLVLPPPTRSAAFARLTRRRGVDLATVSVCCGVGDDGSVRFALGAAGPRPLVVEDTSGTLADPAAPEGDVSGRIGELLAVATPISDVRAGADYRRAMLEVLAHRTLEAALAQREERR